MSEENKQQNTEAMQYDTVLANVLTCPDCKCKEIHKSRIGDIYGAVIVGKCANCGLAFEISKVGDFL